MPSWHYFCSVSSKKKKTKQKTGQIAHGFAIPTLDFAENAPAPKWHDSRISSALKLPDKQLTNFECKATTTKKMCASAIQNN